MNIQKKNFPAQDIKNAISSGADLGTKTGCLLSALYSVLGYMVILTVSGILNFGIAFVIPSLLFYLLILIPVLLLGAITGAILGWLSKILSSKVSRQRFFQIGILVCLIFLVAIHAAFFVLAPLVAEKDSGYKSESYNGFFIQYPPLTPIQTYLLFIGFPSIIYIISGAWVSHKLSLKN